MPLYEYACRVCGGTFEHMRKTSERLTAPACPSCASAEALLVMSAPATVRAAAVRSAAAVPACEGGEGSCCGGACMH